ncbi:MAG: class I SAM-dependent RNA methyltransferase [Desulfovermiculus sp.]|nr:class I SAM-dependent RNA methyltransferase [Desulfovermiculus sp.]
MSEDHISTGIALELTVQDLVWRGRGLARLDSGRVVLIDPGVFPGEKVRVQVTKVKPDYLEAKWSEIVVPHPKRRPHPCPLADRCGGCRFGWLPHRQQLELKTEVVKNELHRALSPTIGSDLPPVQAESSPKKWRYRWRGQMHVNQGQPCMMSLRGGDPLPCPDCLLLARPLSLQVAQLCAGMEDGRISLAASPKTQRAARAGDPVLLDLPLSAYGLDIQVPADVFFQANWAGNQALVDFVCSHIDSAWKVADLYAGAGNFALALGQGGNRVLAMENDSRAVQVGEDNARRLGFDHVRFVRRNLARESARRRLQQEEVQAVIVDPPRTGAGKKLAQTLDLSSLHRMIWVSCDVVNTCRDLKPFLTRGWKISRIKIYDLFPQTWHVETVFILDRA